MSTSPISFRAIDVGKRKFQYKIFGTISFLPSGRSLGIVLISYVVHPFLITEQELNKATHTNPFECLEMVQVFLDLGYAVDVIHFENKVFLPKKAYAMLVDIHKNIERLTPFLLATCIKLHYITGAHWLFHNKSEYQRLADLQRRRGVTLLPHRTVQPSKNIEYADQLAGLGNALIHGTYAYAQKPIYSLPLAFATIFPSLEKSLKERSHKHFVWIGGGGAVHKGLDLVLECFKHMPEYDLTICGPVPSEPDFVDLYRKELYETPNIHLVGRINVRGAQFQEIVNKAVAIIYPSCSEGTPGSVVTAMYAGLIPIVSKEAGIDVHDFGFLLEENSLSEIIRRVKQVSELADDERVQMSLRAKMYAEEHFTRQKFYEAFKKLVSGPLSTNIRLL